MKRHYFFWLAALLAALFGAMMFFAPSSAAQVFNLAPSPAGSVVFRILGGTLLAVALLNLLVSRHPMSPTLRAVLWTDVAVHAIGTIADLWSVAAGDIALGSIAVGLVSHAVVGLGALYFLLRKADA